MRIVQRRVIGCVEEKMKSEEGGSELLMEGLWKKKTPRAVLVVKLKKLLQWWGASFSPLHVNELVGRYSEAGPEIGPFSYSELGTPAPGAPRLRAGPS